MLRLRPLHTELSAYSWVYLIITWFHAGRIRPASGTWGSLAAIPFCFVIQYFFGVTGLLTFALVMAAIGLLATKAYGLKTDHADPSEVVVDEVVGMAIVMMMIPFTFWYWAFGFVLFRAFDSIKRGPVGWCDRNVKGPLGIIVDDVVAGILAGSMLYILNAVIA